MLPKNSRISKKDFQYIVSKGKRYSSPHLLLHAAPILQNTALQSRISFSISKKTTKLASSRNTYRRRGYSAARKYLTHIKPGYLLSFSFKKNPASLSPDSLLKEIRELLYTSGVLS